MNFRRTAIKLISIAVSVCAVASLFSGCGANNSKTIVIYTAAEDYRVKALQDSLKDKFKDKDIHVEYLTTGNLSAKILSEKSNTEADIIYDVDYSYLSLMDKQGILANLDGKYDMGKYTDDTVLSKNYIPDGRDSLSIIMNMDLMKEKNLKEPNSYDDLLDPSYKGLLSMANPKSSGTGYATYLSLVNSRGEKEALDYFDRLTPNILQYTSSGSGPVNALCDNEAAIAIGMTFQGVKKINDGSNFKIKYFSEGSPFALYGQAIVKGKEKKEGVSEVFDYMINTFNQINCEKFCPEPIFKNQKTQVKNYPTNIKYADMKNDTADTKKHLLSLWKN